MSSSSWDNPPHQRLTPQTSCVTQVGQPTPQSFLRLISTETTQGQASMANLTLKYRPWCTQPHCSRDTQASPSKRKPSSHWQPSKHVQLHGAGTERLEQVKSQVRVQSS